MAQINQLPIKVQTQSTIKSEASELMFNQQNINLKLIHGKEIKQNWLVSEQDKNQEIYQYYLLKSFLLQEIKQNYDALIQNEPENIQQIENLHNEIFAINQPIKTEIIKQETKKHILELENFQNKFCHQLTQEFELQKVRGLLKKNLFRMAKFDQTGLHVESKIQTAQELNKSQTSNKEQVNQQKSNQNRTYEFNTLLYEVEQKQDKQSNQNQKQIKENNLNVQDNSANNKLLGSEMVSNNYQLQNKSSINNNGILNDKIQIEWRPNYIYRLYFHQINTQVSQDFVVYIKQSNQIRKLQDLMIVSKLLQISKIQDQIVNTQACKVIGKITKIKSFYKRRIVIEFFNKYIYQRQNKNRERSQSSNSHNQLETSNNSSEFYNLEYQSNNTSNNQKNVQLPEINVGGREYAYSITYSDEQSQDLISPKNEYKNKNSPILSFVAPNQRRQSSPQSPQIEPMSPYKKSGTIVDKLVKIKELQDEFIDNESDEISIHNKRQSKQIEIQYKEEDEDEYNENSQQLLHQKKATKQMVSNKVLSNVSFQNSLESAESDNNNNQPDRNSFGIKQQGYQYHKIQQQKQQNKQWLEDNYNQQDNQLYSLTQQYLNDLEQYAYQEVNRIKQQQQEEGIKKNLPDNQNFQIVVTQNDDNQQQQIKKQGGQFVKQFNKGDQSQSHYLRSNYDKRIEDTPKFSDQEQGQENNYDLNLNSSEYGRTKKKKTFIQFEQQQFINNQSLQQFNQKQMSQQHLNTQKYNPDLQILQNSNAYQYSKEGEQNSSDRKISPNQSAQFKYIQSILGDKYQNYINSQQQQHSDKQIIQTQKSDIRQITSNPQQTINNDLNSNRKQILSIKQQQQQNKVSIILRFEQLELLSLQKPASLLFAKIKINQLFNSGQQNQGTSIYQFLSSKQQKEYQQKNNKLQTVDQIPISHNLDHQIFQLSLIDENPKTNLFKFLFDDGEVKINEYSLEYLKNLSLNIIFYNNTEENDQLCNTHIKISQFLDEEIKAAIKWIYIPINSNKQLQINQVQSSFLQIQIFQISEKEQNQFSNQIPIEIQQSMQVKMIQQQELNQYPQKSKDIYEIICPIHNAPLQLSIINVKIMQSLHTLFKQLFDYCSTQQVKNYILQMQQKIDNTQYIIDNNLSFEHIILNLLIVIKINYYSAMLRQSNLLQLKEEHWLHYQEQLINLQNISQSAIQNNQKLEDYKHQFFQLCNNGLIPEVRPQIYSELCNQTKIMQTTFYNIIKYLEKNFSQYNRNQFFSQFISINKQNSFIAKKSLEDFIKDPLQTLILSELMFMGLSQEANQIITKNHQQVIEDFDNYSSIAINKNECGCFTRLIEENNISNNMIDRNIIQTFLFWLDINGYGYQFQYVFSLQPIINKIKIIVSYKERINQQQKINQNKDYYQSKLERDSFWMLCQFYQIGLFQYYTSSSEMLKKDIFITDKLIKEKYPNFYKKMNNLDISTELLFTQMFLTLYADAFNYELLYQIWDLILVHLKIDFSRFNSTIIAIALTLIDNIEKIILTSNNNDFVEGSQLINFISLYCKLETNCEQFINKVTLSINSQTLQQKKQQEALSTLSGQQIQPTLYNQLEALYFLEKQYKESKNIIIQQNNVLLNLIQQNLSSNNQNLSSNNQNLSYIDLLNSIYQNLIQSNAIPSHILQSVHFYFHTTIADPAECFELIIIYNNQSVSKIQIIKQNKIDKYFILCPKDVDQELMGNIIQFSLINKNQKLQYFGSLNLKNFNFNRIYKVEIPLYQLVQDIDHQKINQSILQQLQILYQNQETQFNLFTQNQVFLSLSLLLLPFQQNQESSNYQINQDSQDDEENQNVYRIFKEIQFYSDLKSQQKIIQNAQIDLKVQLEDKQVYNQNYNFIEFLDNAKRFNSQNPGIFLDHFAISNTLEEDWKSNSIIEDEDSFLNMFNFSKNNPLAIQIQQIGNKLFSVLSRNIQRKFFFLEFILFFTLISDGTLNQKYDLIFKYLLLFQRKKQETITGEIFFSFLLNFLQRINCISTYSQVEQYIYQCPLQKYFPLKAKLIEAEFCFKIQNQQKSINCLHFFNSILDQLYQIRPFGFLNIAEQDFVKLFNIYIKQQLSNTVLADNGLLLIQYFNNQSLVQSTFQFILVNKNYILKNEDVQNQQNIDIIQHMMMNNKYLITLNSTQVQITKNEFFIIMNSLPFNSYYLSNRTLIPDTLQNEIPVVIYEKNVIYNVKFYQSQSKKFLSTLLFADKRSSINSADRLQQMHGPSWDSKQEIIYLENMSIYNQVSQIITKIGNVFNKQQKKNLEMNNITIYNSILVLQEDDIHQETILDKDQNLFIQIKDKKFLQTSNIYQKDAIIKLCLFINNSKYLNYQDKPEQTCQIISKSSLIKIYFNNLNIFKWIPCYSYTQQFQYNYQNQNVIVLMCSSQGHLLIYTNTNEITSFITDINIVNNILYKQNLTNQEIIQKQKSLGQTQNHYKDNTNNINLVSQQQKQPNLDSQQYKQPIIKSQSASIQQTAANSEHNQQFKQSQNKSPFNNFSNKLAKTQSQTQNQSEYQRQPENVSASSKVLQSQQQQSAIISEQYVQNLTEWVLNNQENNQNIKLSNNQKQMYND